MAVIDFATMTEALRSYLVDETTHNKLNMDQEIFEDSDYEAAIKQAASEWNTSPPLGVAPIDDIENTSIEEDIWVILMKGASCYMIDKYTMRDLHNALQYNDSGGMSVSEYGKDQNYRIMRDSLWADYQTQKTNYKKAVNLGTFWG